MVLTQEQEDDLAFRVTVGFAKKFGVAIDGHLAKLFNMLPPGTGSDQIRLLLTGRGSLFPLTDSLIRPLAAQHMKIDMNNGIIAAQGESAKAVTSWGALALASASRVSRFLNFEGLVAADGSRAGSAYAVYAKNLRRGGWSHCRLEPIAGEEGAWGVPLITLPAQFTAAVRIQVGEDRGGDAPTESLANLSGFNLTARLAKSPAAWLVFRAPGVLGVEEFSLSEESPASAETTPAEETAE